MIQKAAMEKDRKQPQHVHLDEDDEALEGPTPRSGADGRVSPLIEDDNDHEGRQERSGGEWGSLFDVQD